MAKWVAQIDRADRIPEYVPRAFTTACAGGPGPVVLALPEDMLATESDVPPTRRATTRRGRTRRRGVAAAARRCSRARSRSSSSAAAAGRRRRRDHARVPRGDELPAGAAFRRQDTLDNDQPSYAGDVGSASTPSSRQRVRDADLLLVAARAWARSTTSRLHAARVPEADRRRPRPPGRGGARPRLPAGAADPRGRRSSSPRASRELRGRAALARVGGRGARGLRGLAARMAPLPGNLDSASASRDLRERAPDAIVTNGAGNFTVWAHRFWRSGTIRTQLAPTSGAMGYGVPAAVAAKARRTRSAPSSASPATATS